MNVINDLTEKRCIACEGNEEPLSAQDAARYMEKINEEWKLDDGGTEIKRRFTFPDFKTSMAFANQVADLAEEEGHHPSMKISYGRVKIELTTHAISGLSENDFIMAAKIDQLAS